MARVSEQKKIGQQLKVDRNSRLVDRKGIVPKGLLVEKSMFAMSPSFQVGTLIVGGIITALYTLFW